jgi:Fe-S-cluster containining protein
MDALYRDLANDIALLPRRCEQSGVCCRFDGPKAHRLYVTAIEVCYYLSARSPWPATGETCPHQAGGLCGIREARPLGCRVYYCDSASQAWQGPMTETYLARLRAMHHEFDVPYFYADWLTVLNAIRADGVFEAVPTGDASATRLVLPVLRGA